LVLEFLSELYMNIVNTISAAMGPANDYPLAALSIILITIAMAALSSATMRLLVDGPSLKRRMAELQAYNNERMRAMRAKDQKALDKLKKRQPAMSRLQAEVQREQLKPTFFTFVPFIIFYYIFSGVFGFNQVVVAYSPITLPLVGDTFNFWTWYFLTSIAVSPFIQRLFNVPTVSD